jgi:hypothetical protein
MAPGAAQSSKGDAGSGEKLLEAAHKKAMKETKARPLKKRNTEEQVNRCLKDNFKDFSSQEIDSIEIDGLTLRQRLARDKRESRKNKEMHMGSNYYRMLKDKYRSSDSVVKKLEVENQHELLSPELRTALVALKNANCNKSPLLEFMSRVETLNQREVIGLFRGTLDLKPNISQKHTQVLIDLMRMILRLNVDTKFEKETKLMLPLFDETLCACWDRLKKGRVGPAEFWTLYGDVGSLIMMKDDVATIMECGSDFKSVSDEIARCTAGCKLGARMFGQAWLWVEVSLKTWGQ